ncbi:hypothetical protein [Roseateles depolymerans]|uniref:Uncharacterized protein n=1 Tax=Roseateles depolymerans TaxID=76731 RepID=A0A0U3MVM6_9BURK|nr:hypothetical protein [Roseateles depolymerans]ALV07059.1 hypothetical protein RD2015_2594 [Roseateles depolymerans]REG20042.1 hypothetical protein DES44_2548 [Roseateles depolymerans]
MSSGCTQDDRYPPALFDGYLQVDPLRFEDRVTMVELLADKLRYVDPDNNDAGRWRELLERDTSLVMARIAAFDLGQWERRLARELDSAPVESLGQQIGDLASVMDQWYGALNQDAAATPDPAGQALAERLRQLVRQQLAADLHWVRQRYAQRAFRQRPVVPTLSALWTPSPEDLALLAEQRAPLSGRHLARYERDQLRRRQVAFLGAIDSLQAKARELLPASWGTGQHEPAVALLIAFIKVLEKVQGLINRFPARHADFYYREVLGFLPRGPRDDTVLLACQRDPRAKGDVQVGAGVLFDAGKDAAGRPVRFRSEQPLAVTDTRVASVRSLFLERQSAISPECRFGFVTQAKAGTLGLGQGQEVRLFGGDPATPQARIGLAIISPILALAEGERMIHIELRMRRDTAFTARSLKELIADIEAVGDLPHATPEDREQRDAALQRAMGLLLVRWMMADEASLTHTPLTPKDWQRVWDLVKRLNGPQPTASTADPMSLFSPGTGGLTPEPNRELIFTSLFQRALRLSLSASDGWLEASDVQVSPAVSGGLLLQVRLPASAPAIIGCDPVLHGDEWGTRLPMARLELGQAGGCYAYSLLCDVPLKEAVIRVNVSGVRQLLLSNSLGRLDATKPFMPFGPLPMVSSSVMVGSQEAARKNLTRMVLHLQWSGLPQGPGGFTSHYAGYGLQQRTETFTATLSLLRDGQWVPCGATPTLRLFSTDGEGRLLDEQELQADSATLAHQMRASEALWDSQNPPRNGLLRLQLAAPQAAFGHAAYPSVLSEVVATNARLRRRPRPVPQPPYTPLLETLSLDYDADTVIALDRDDGPGEGVDGERLMHLRPFGMTSLHEGDALSGQTVLPRFDFDGQLLIGLESSDPAGPLTLLFELKESPVRPGQQRALTRPQWAVLHRDHWLPLPTHAVLSDETDGFLTSGIITLELPGDLSCDQSLMPGGLFWLRVGAQDGFDTFARLRDIRCQALRAVRAPAPPAPAPTKAPPPAPPTLLEAGRIQRAITTLSGVTRIAQVGTSVGLRPAEDVRALYTRAGERLMHKNRASTAWDLERLLLDRFPEVFKARCLTADEVVDDAGQHGDHLPPGSVVVVAVPTVPRNQPQLACEQPRFSAVQLRRMAATLRALASPFAHIEVRNPMYEQLQLRGVVGLQPGAHPGATLQRLNRSLVEMLSPWMDSGYPARFDWTIRAEDIEARLRMQPGVAFITQLSLLRVSQDDNGLYRLADTAREARDERRHIRSSRPWSLAVPMPQHLLTDTHGFSHSAPLPTGISKLAIGSTFVIRGANA